MASSSPTKYRITYYRLAGGFDSEITVQLEDLLSFDYDINKYAEFIQGDRPLWFHARKI